MNLDHISQYSEWPELLVLPKGKTYTFYFLLQGLAPLQGVHKNSEDRKNAP